MSLPPLVDGPRRIWFAALVATGFMQGGAAALGAWVSGQAIGAAAIGNGLAAGEAMLLLATAAMAAAAGFAERFVGEELAQAYVFDLRRRLFSASMSAAGSVAHTRLLMPFVGDLTAVRNWAARGPAAILTASAAAFGGATLLVLQAPGLALGLTPLLLALIVLQILYTRLSTLIGEQRNARGRLTRFVTGRLRRAARQQPYKPDATVEDDTVGLSRRAVRLAVISVRRAQIVGLMDATALFAGGLSLLAILALAVGGNVDSTAVISVVGLTAFLSTRLLDIARALHALAGGAVALDNLENRL